MLMELSIPLNDVLKNADLYIRTLDTEQILTDRDGTENKKTSQYEKKIPNRQIRITTIVQTSGS